MQNLISCHKTRRLITVDSVVIKFTAISLNDKIILEEINTSDTIVIAPDKGGGRGIEDNQKDFFLFFNKNICCDPSLEPFRRGSDDGSQNMFLCRNIANYP